MTIDDEHGEKEGKMAIVLLEEKKA